MRRFGRALVLILTDPLARPRLATVLWGTAAIVSLVFACGVAIQPDRSRDFWEVRRWLDYWALGAHDPYTNLKIAVDYPPYALLFLAPLAWIPPSVAPLLLAVANALLCVLASWLVVTVTVELAELRLQRLDVWALTAVVASWGAFRTSIWLGQTMPVALVMALYAIRWSQRHPAWAGAAFGVATFKLNMTAGFAVALLLLRRVKPFIVAVLVMGIGTAAFALTLGVSSFRVAAEYVGRLTSMYGDSGNVPDWLSARRLVHALLGHGGGAATAYYVFAVCAFALLVWCARRARRARLGPALTFAASLLWVLMDVSQQRFNAVLLAPAFVLVLVPQARVVGNEAARRWVAGTLAVVMALDLPLVVRLVGARYPTVLPVDLSLVADYGARLLVVGTFALILWRLSRLGAAPPPARLEDGRDPPFMK